MTFELRDSWTILEHFSSDLKIVSQAVFDNVDDAAKRQDLMNIAKTTLSSKFAATNKELFANLAVDAVLRLKGSGNRDAIQVIKVVGGDLSLSFLDEGTHKTQIRILHKRVGAPKIVEKYFMPVRTILDSGFVTRGKENYASVLEVFIVDLFFRFHSQEAYRPEPA